MSESTATLARKTDRAPEIFVNRLPFMVGRHNDTDCQINHGLVSRHHCLFFAGEGGVWLQDLESKNGTFLHGDRLETPQLIHDGDLIHLGSLLLKVRLDVG